MKIPSLLAAGALALGLTRSMNAQPKEAALPKETLELTLSRKVELQYLFYLPKGYPAQGGQKWPLMLFLHGAGERGTNVQLVGVHGPMSLVKQGRDFPFIIVAPQCPEGARWEKDVLLKLLETVTSKYAVDTNRIYLTGLSMGGYGTWDLGVSYPERFAAIAPICGGGQVLDVLLAGFGKSSNPLATLPVWAFHGAKDPVVPLEESERMIAALKRGGAKDARLTVYPEAQHNAWTETYNNPEFYTWLLAHSLTDPSRARK